jgi:hypothetical protein
VTIETIFANRRDRRTVRSERRTTQKRANESGATNLTQTGHWQYRNFADQAGFVTRTFDPFNFNPCPTGRSLRQRNPNLARRVRRRSTIAAIALTRFDFRGRFATAILAQRFADIVRFFETPAGSTAHESLVCACVDQLPFAGAAFLCFTRFCC